jgi:hypothetical protein
MMVAWRSATADLSPCLFAQFLWHPQACPYGSAWGCHKNTAVPLAYLVSVGLPQTNWPSQNCSDWV